MTSPSVRFGQPWSATRDVVLGSLTVALLIGGLGAWSVLTTLSGAVIAPGQIEVSQSRQVVQHPDVGIVESILVREGARVAAGEVLLRLDGSVLQSELAIVNGQLLELAARRARLEALRDGFTVLAFPANVTKAAALDGKVAEVVAGQVSLFDRQTASIAEAQKLRRSRVARIESQILGLTAQQDAAAMEATLLQTELLKLKDLLKQGLIPSVRVSELERELARLLGRQGELAAAQAEAAGRITETEIEIAALLTQSREKAETELRDVVARQLELTERASALAGRIDRLDIRAPATGLVLGLMVTTPRSVIRPAETLMSIVPRDRPLLAVARVPAAHVDEVHIGQSVQLVFSTLPTRNMPEVTGTVTLVSADAWPDQSTGIAYYRTEISIDAPALESFAGVEIVPGMPVSAFLRTEDRTPLSYLLKPFTDYLRGAFRET